MKNQDIPRLIELGIIPAHLVSPWNRGAAKTESTKRIEEDVGSIYFYLNAGWILILISGISFCVGAACYYSENYSVGDKWMLAGVVTIFFAFIAIMISVRARLDVRSKALCHQLELLAAYSGLHIRMVFGTDEAETKKICSDCLVHHARQVIATERLRFQLERELIRMKEKEGWNSASASLTKNHLQEAKDKKVEEARTTFKLVHAVFLQFELVDKIWDGYFAAAAVAMPQTETADLAKA